MAPSPWATPITRLRWPRILCTNSSTLPISTIFPCLDSQSIRPPVHLRRFPARLFLPNSHGPSRCILQARFYMSRVVQEVFLCTVLTGQALPHSYVKLTPRTSDPPDTPSILKESVSVHRTY